MMQEGGLWTTSISTFPERHSAFHFLAGFNEWYNLGTRGLETADQVSALALNWIERNARREDWFLHVHLWDPHTPYRTPLAFGDPFAGAPSPGWLTDEVRRAHWTLPGPHSAQEISGFGPRTIWDDYPRQPDVASDMSEVRRMFDGYDTGLLYADHHVGLILDALSSQGVYDDTAVMISADHGETLGELGIYCDHQTADHHVCRVPMIVRWPGIGPGANGQDTALHYQIDIAATVLELLRLEIPERWDGRSFASTFGGAAPEAREFLVLTQGAWTAQRAVRFDDSIYIRTYDDGYHAFPEQMLFNLVDDPHEQHDLMSTSPHIALRAAELLDSWLADALGDGSPGGDPLMTLLREGGPWHARQGSEDYPAHLRATGRSRWGTVQEIKK
jgi:arylsulfatase A-like enzyme